VAKFTKDELNIIFLALTGVVYEETEIVENLRKKDKHRIESVLVKLDTVLEGMDVDKSLN
jgi:hypothetical protein